MLCRTLIVSACVLLLSGCQSTGGTKILVNGKPFKEVDVNNDGGISEQELLGDRKKAFNIMDINGDERLVFSEYQTVMMIPHQVKMAERRKDAQGDPVILKLVEQMEETYPKVIEEKFSKLDKNKDKKITYEEYQVSVKKIVENLA